MRGLIPVLCVLAVFGVIGSFQSPTTAVDLPPRVVDLPTRPVAYEPAAFPVVPIADDPAVCVDGSCSPAMSSSGVSSSDGYSATGPVRRLVEKKPVRRIVGRVFSRLRGCR